MGDECQDGPREVVTRIAHLRSVSRNELPPLLRDLRAAESAVSEACFDGHEAFLGQMFEGAGDAFFDVLWELDQLLVNVNEVTDKTIDAFKALETNWMDAEDVASDELDEVYRCLQPDLGGN